MCAMIAATGGVAIATRDSHWRQYASNLSVRLLYATVSLISISISVFVDIVFLVARTFGAYNPRCNRPNYVDDKFVVRASHKRTPVVLDSFGQSSDIVLT